MLILISYICGIAQTGCTAFFINTATMFITRALSFILPVVMLLSACASGPVKQTESGIIVKVQNQTEDGARLVRLEVFGDKLIRVSATPERKFSDQQSLVVLPAQNKTPFEVAQNGDTVTLKTSAVQARVLVTTGEVSFADCCGNTLLKEQEGGGGTI